ncbi:MAG: NAD(P)-dependent oxidoreductase, partial [Oscillospiraceae bacterium]|nr:NAD(P)-dependent oxidoreductase [Oscillospiraceae bacterium]
MSSFPICVEMRGETIILAGSGKIAEEKLEKLLLFEARILLFVESGFEGLSHPQVMLHRRRLTEEDLEQKPLFVVAAEEERENNRVISCWCRERKIPVNVVDDPELCSF